jgi:hypothetical protein
MSKIFTISSPVCPSLSGMAEKSKIFTISSPVCPSLSGMANSPKKRYWN